jgi:hypothetical protein
MLDIAAKLRLEVLSVLIGARSFELKKLHPKQYMETLQGLLAEVKQASSDLDTGIKALPSPNDPSVACLVLGLKDYQEQLSKIDTTIKQLQHSPDERK